MFYIYPHLGLGDAILCNGLIRNICKIYDEVTLAVTLQNVESIRYMFRDLNLQYMITTDIEMINFLKNVASYNKFEISETFIRNNIGTYNFDECFYRQNDLDYNKRWSDFYIKRDSTLEDEALKMLIPKTPFIFVHDDISRGFKIKEDYLDSTLPIFRPDNTYTGNIFAYLKILENAKEIHCMDSSFKHLVDSMTTIKAKLFYHIYVRGSSKYSWTKSKLDWTPILE